MTHGEPQIELAGLSGGRRGFESEVRYCRSPRRDPPFFTLELATSLTCLSERKRRALRCAEPCRIEPEPWGASHGEEPAWSRIGGPLSAFPPTRLATLDLLLRAEPRAPNSIRRFCLHRPAESRPARNWLGRSPGTRSPRQSPLGRPDARPALARRAVAARRPWTPCLRCGSAPD
jgi:hypothetical protein